MRSYPISVRNSILRIGLGVFAAVLTSSLKLDYIESLLFDFRLHFRPSQQTSHNITIINVRPESKAKFQGFPGFKEYGQVLERLSQYKPRAVVIVADPKNLSGDQVAMNSFVDSAAKFEQIFFSADHASFKGGLELVPFDPPLNKIRIVPGSKTSDSDKFARDGVSRRIVVSFQDTQYLHWILAKQFNPDLSSLENIKGRFNVFESQQVWINYHSPGSFPTFRFDDVYDGKVEPSQFENKIVILGNDTEFDSKDYAQSPYSRDHATMSLSELHANMFETLITNSAPKQLPTALDFILTTFISILTIHVVLTIRPVFGILILGSTGLGFFILSYLAFFPFGYMVDMAHPLLAIFLCYYFFIPYRLIIENRRSWEYYQKHKILSEVEQLKTNFIGMMSHDLKTPLARIQGMTEVIAKDPSPMSSQQREALDLIKQSAEDLTRFISAILNYAKIESQGVTLNLQSKDINQLLEDVLKKNEFMARLKQIEIVAELEPLFSIPIDPDLIKQVLSNLLENAIKYSPEGSKILVSSEEKEGKILIQVADQGVGIPPGDLEHVFMKFFRSASAKSSAVKGSGLGLYLAKYFVELHKGRIFVESTPGQGSTFTVELPTSAT